MDAKTHERIERDFTNHPPKDAVTGELLDLISEHVKDLGHWLADNIPDCREASQAISALELVSFHSKAAVARNQE